MLDAFFITEKNNPILMKNQGEKGKIKSVRDEKTEDFRFSAIYTTCLGVRIETNCIIPQLIIVS